ncbi:hypothetical protein [Tenacibaculum piscium]|uniref:hypothetical protein n=1 Tax=Tenacibaculum piscium TaxID=1458515 RepID=UPI001F3F7980|nr:hypothetical protein [Tenacibaculum piscium]
MKILRVLLLVFFFLIAFNASGQQISENALGIRVGDNDGFGGEISYQYYVKDNNRLEFDLGFRNTEKVDAFKLVGLYQWVQNLDGNFNWFVGFGAGLGSFNDTSKDSSNGLFALIAGNLGIEYNFDIPLLVSLDIRPELGFNDNYSNGLDLDIALGIRYQF